MPEGIITALRAQEHDARHVNLYINHAFALSVSLTTIARERLCVGMYLDAAAYARIEAAECIERAVQTALRAIESRPRSVAEVRGYLQRKGFSSETVNAAIERLQRSGLLDDAAFARFWIENRQTCRPRGRHALAEELRRKGVNAEVVAVALDTSLTDDETERAEMLARAAMRRYATVADYQTFVRRLSGYLQRRGFSVDVILPIIERLWRERGSRDSVDPGVNVEQDEG
ncbi:MAG: regulatory protein RecX [Roseiflexus sp.]|jgi:regulatory protein|nr:regulatory protein RecX [Roseiflexus sp.]MBO9334177.1 regulatory protein RecX [Roseiflexus sp.]MBO9365359.1 regulatory protein RecX [Roseiflexus sp.]MBO9381995.1 regulatory protein RecX [Roseiflexus sp.]MBO9389403.1 regulatory protein RecX [Roseiflexus sp.]